MTLACSCLMGRVCLVFKIVWKNKFNANIFYWVLCRGNIIPPALCRNFNHFEMKFSRNSVVSMSKQRRNFDVDSICVFDHFFDVVVPTGLFNTNNNYLRLHLMRGSLGRLAECATNFSARYLKCSVETAKQLLIMKI